MTAARPTRQRKGDRLLCPGATSAEIACDHALAPFDRAALDSERRWGIERLPGLVSPEMAAKYGAAIAHLNDRINAGDPDGVAAAATNCIRGLAAMDAEAIARGHRPVPAEVWVFDEVIDGKRVRLGITREPGDWPTLQDSHPGLPIYSLREVAVKMTPGLLEAAVKSVFPGAQVTATRHVSPLDDVLEDHIPF